MDLKYLIDNLKIIYYEKGKNNKLAIEHNKDCLVHSEGLYPERVLKKRYYEDNFTFDWRKRNYTPISKPLWDKALSNIKRIFLKSEFGFDTSEEFKNYNKTNPFFGMNLADFLSEKVMKIMLEDPNAWLVVVPSGDGLIDQTKNVNPKILIVNSEDQIYQDEELIVFAENNYIFIITKNEYFLFEKDNQDNFSILQYYNHELNEIPYVITGGNWSSLNLYTSYFSKFITIGNEILKQFSDYIMTLTINGYPVRQISELALSDGTCVGEDCNKSILSQVGISNVLIKKQGNAVTGNNGDEDLLKYISPPVDGINAQKDAFETLYELGKEALYLKYIDEQQSGAAKSIDREDLYAFISTVSNRLFNIILYKILLYCEKLLNPFLTDYTPQIYAPQTFYIKSEEELLKKFNESYQLGAEASVIEYNYTEYINSKFGNLSIDKKKSKVLLLFDKLFPYNLDLKLEMVANNLATKEDAEKSTIANFLLERLIFELGENVFINEDINILLKKLDKLYEETKIYKENVNSLETTTNNIQQNGR